MFKKLPPGAGMFILTGLLMISCNQATGPSPARQIETPGSKGSRAVAKADWEQKWENVILEAKKERSVAIYTMWPAHLRTSLIKPLKDKYGIDLEVSPFGRGGEIPVKIRAEHRAGLYLADVIGVGTETILGDMKPAGLLGPIGPLLILPEVTDPKLWRGGSLPFVDKDKTFLGVLFNKQIHIIYNTDLVKEGEITTYKDVLKPQYKGKITLNDPTVAGVGNGFMSFLAYNLWNVDEAREFLRWLIKEQQVVIQRDNRINVESVARGKFAIALAPQVTLLDEFTRAGAPLAAVDIKEGTQISYGYAGLAIPARLAHPNATTVFVNWLLSKEGQTVYSKAAGTPGMRTDVSTEGFLPLTVPKPGEKLFMTDEELIIRKAEFLRITQKIVEEASR